MLKLLAIITGLTVPVSASLPILYQNINSSNLVKSEYIPEHSITPWVILSDLNTVYSSENFKGNGLETKEVEFVRSTQLIVKNLIADKDINVANIAGNFVIDANEPFKYQNITLIREDIENNESATFVGKITKTNFFEDEKFMASMDVKLTFYVDEFGKGTIKTNLITTTLDAQDYLNLVTRQEGISTSFAVESLNLFINNNKEISNDIGNTEFYRSDKMFASNSLVLTTPEHKKSLNTGGLAVRLRNERYDPMKIKRISHEGLIRYSASSGSTNFNSIHKGIDLLKSEQQSTPDNLIFEGQIKTVKAGTSPFSMAMNIRINADIDHEAGWTTYTSETELDLDLTQAVQNSWLEITYIMNKVVMWE